MYKFVFKTRVHLTAAAWIKYDNRILDVREMGVGPLSKILRSGTPVAPRCKILHRGYTKLGYF